MAQCHPPIIFELVQYWTEVHPYKVYHRVAMLSGGLHATGINQPGISMQAVSGGDQIRVKLRPWFGFDSRRASERGGRFE